MFTALKADPNNWLASCQVDARNAGRVMPDAPETKSSLRISAFTSTRIAKILEEFGD